MHFSSDFRVYLDYTFDQFTIPLQTISGEIQRPQVTLQRLYRLSDIKCLLSLGKWLPKLGLQFLHQHTYLEHFQPQVLFMLISLICHCTCYFAILLFTAASRLSIASDRDCLLTHLKSNFHSGQFAIQNRLGKAILIPRVVNSYILAHCFEILLKQVCPYKHLFTGKKWVHNRREYLFS